MLKVILFAGSLWLCCLTSGMMNTFQSPLSGSNFRDCGPGYTSYCISREIHHIEAFPPAHAHFNHIRFTPLMQRMGGTCCQEEDRNSSHSSYEKSDKMKEAGISLFSPDLVTNHSNMRNGIKMRLIQLGQYVYAQSDIWISARKIQFFCPAVAAAEVKGLLMQTCLCACTLCTAVHLLSGFSEVHCGQNEVARKLFFCAGVQHLYIWCSFLPMKENTLHSVFLCKFHSCHDWEAAFGSSGDIKAPHWNPKVEDHFGSAAVWTRKPGTHFCVFQEEWNAQRRLDLCPFSAI